MKLIQSTGPYILFGWSLGGLLAFEIGRQLIEMGHGVSKIIIVDSPFCYKDVVEKVAANRELLIQPIDYEYNQHLSYHGEDLTLIYFKANKIPSLAMLQKMFPAENINDAYKIFKHYKKTKANYIDKITRIKNLRIISLEGDHYSWIQEKDLIIKVINEI
jgi:thioesterase domain-containing protein